MITFAPKTKGEQTYRYHRCSDGKRVHHDRRERQVNVTEEDLLNQLGDAVDLITITEDLAQLVATALSETHRQAQRAKEKAITSYRVQIAMIDERENRVVDLFANGELDPEVFKRQQVRVREERDGVFSKLQEAERLSDDAYLVTAARVLELAKCAKDLWKQ